MNKPGMPLAASTESSFDISTKIAPGSSDIIVSTPADFIGAGAIQFRSLLLVITFSGVVCNNNSSS